MTRLFLMLAIVLNIATCKIFSQSSGLYIYTKGDNNIGLGLNALNNCTNGTSNIALGNNALNRNRDGSENISLGCHTLSRLVTGTNNIAIGCNSLSGIINAHNNIGIGRKSLANNVVGENNLAIGNYCGHGLRTGDNNIYIGHNIIAPDQDECNTVRIGSTGATSKCYIPSIGNARLSGRTNNIKISRDGQIGVVGSSERFKEKINPMTNFDKLFEKILQLTPVTFNYTDDLEKNLQFGLIAEAVDKILPELVVYDDENKPFTIQYEMLIPILVFVCQHAYTTLNDRHTEMLEKHAIQEEEIASLKNQIEALTAASS